MKLVTYLIIYPAILTISYLPFRILYFCSDITYYLLYYVFRYRRKIVRFNLEISKISNSKKELIEIEKKFYRHITCNIKLDGRSPFSLVSKLDFPIKNLST